MGMGSVPEAMSGIKKLSEFARLAELRFAEFEKRVSAPVLMVGASKGQGGRDKSSTNTATLPPFGQGDVEEIVVSLQAKAGKSDALLVIGRGASADVTLPFETISRAHAQLARDDGGGHFITDMGSKNGTWLNGERLLSNQAYAVRDGDTIKFGDVEGVLMSPAMFFRVLHEADDRRAL